MTKKERILFMGRCYNCGSIELFNYLNVKDYFSKELFDYFICHHCGLVQLIDFSSIDNFQKYYPDDYTPFLHKVDLSAYLVQAKIVKKFFPFGKTVLDIGCGRGDFLQIVRNNYNLRPFGIEINDKLAKEIEETMNIEIIGKTLDSVPEHMHFDIITMWDVFEHLPDPISSLKKVFEMLPENGAFVFSVPNMSSFDKFLFRKYWIGLDAPRHIFLFSNYLLHEILNGLGFEVLATKCITGSKGSFMLSVKNAIGEASSESFLIKVLSLIFFPYRKLSYILNRGPVITFITRKNGAIISQKVSNHE